MKLKSDAIIWIINLVALSLHVLSDIETGPGGHFIITWDVLSEDLTKSGSYELCSKVIRSLSDFTIDFTAEWSDPFITQTRSFEILWYDVLYDTDTGPWGPVQYKCRFTDKGSSFPPLMTVFPSVCIVEIQHLHTEWPLGLTTEINWD